MSDKGNSIFIDDKDFYIKGTKNLLSDPRKFERITLKNGAFLNFALH